MLLKVMVCLSTQFGHPGDGYGGRSPTLLHKRPVSAKDMGIAHRDWPVGSKIRVKNLRTGKTATALVIDRGPYGMVDAKGWFNSRRERKRAERLIKKVGKDKAYRGCADLTPRLAKAIGHNGNEQVELTLVPLRPRISQHGKHTPKNGTRTPKHPKAHLE